MYDLDDAIDDLLRESDAEIYGTDDYNAIVEELREFNSCHAPDSGRFCSGRGWSDAARAAFTAAHQDKASGTSWRKASRGAYKRMQRKDLKKMLKMLRQQFEAPPKRTGGQHRFHIYA